MTQKDYTLIRSKRKTIALYINRAILEVRAPLNVSQKEIDRFIASKQAWINKHLLIQEQSLHKRAQFTLTYGSFVSMGGRKYLLSAVAGSRAGFDDDREVADKHQNQAGLDKNRRGCDDGRFILPPGLSPEMIKRVVIEGYKKAAKILLTKKTSEYAKIMKLTPRDVRISSAKTRWGSCSAGNSISFSWRLIMGDDDGIDYVVVHELAHIQEHNHSDKFWAVVGSVLPDYKQRKEKLKELQRRLASEDWD